MNSTVTAEQALGAEQQGNKAIQAVIDAHEQFEQVFGENAKTVWQSLIETDYQDSILNKLSHLK